MSVTKKAFGMTTDGKEASLYSISNAGITAEVTDYGACLVNLFTPDKNGSAEDILLGFDDVTGYESNGSFFGALVAPSANRIGGAKFVIDDVTYELPDNDGGNNLHTDHANGGHKRFWKTTVGENSVTFELALADMDLYMPGNRVIKVTYTVTDDAALELHYVGTSDKKTLFNPTNHAYFNLSGKRLEKVYDTTLQLHCSCYTPVVAGAIPTGELAQVKGTPLDFTEEKTIGRDIDADYEQLKLVLGFDHNFCVDGWSEETGRALTLLPVACAKEPVSGRCMEVFTTLPGVQFYAGNCISGTTKGGRAAEPRDGFCLETQYYPNSINQKNFPQPVFGADDQYESVTVYKFGTC